jgi:hypothetical protein
MHSKKIPNKSKCPHFHSLRMEWARLCKTWKKSQRRLKTLCEENYDCLINDDSLSCLFSSLIRLALCCYFCVRPLSLPDSSLSLTREWVMCFWKRPFLIKNQLINAFMASEWRANLFNTNNAIKTPLAAHHRARSLRDSNVSWINYL